MYRYNRSSSIRDVGGVGRSYEKPRVPAGRRSSPR